MTINEKILSAAVFLGQPSGSLFTVDGTGFLVHVTEEEFSFAYLVSVKHVVWPEWRDRNAKKPPDGDVFIRVNRRGDAPHPIKTPRSHWYYHPDRFVDICALIIGGSADFQGLEHSGINMDSTFHFDADETPPINLGDEVFIVGAFVGRVGERKNIPVVRMGNVAAMPVEPVDHASPRHPAYLVEMRSLGGVSGSPVYQDLEEATTARPGYGPVRQHGEMTVFPYRLIGMVLGTHSAKYESDFVSEADTDLRTPKDVDFNSGISVVLPAQRIADFLNSPELKGDRMKSIEARRKLSGFKPTSAGSPLPAGDAPQPAATSSPHKEAFTSLLNAAVRTKPQAD